MVVHGDRQDPLRVILADHIIFKDFADVARARDPVTRLDQRRLVLLTDDVHAELDALIANEHGRSSDQLPDLVLALAAKRAVERIFRVAAAGFGHRHSVTGPVQRRLPWPFGPTGMHRGPPASEVQVYVLPTDQQPLNY